MKIGGVMAVVSIPLALMLLVIGGPEGGTLGLVAGAIGFAMFLIASAVLERKP